MVASLRGVWATAGALVAGCVLAAGCASPQAPGVAKPPAQVVPGVVAGQPASPGGSGSSAGPAGPAGTRGSVLLGGWAPGGAANLVAAGALAYFMWLNAHGGVYGRAIVYRVLDSRGGARVVPSLAHRLVQGESVFAVFGVQGAQPAAVTGFFDAAGVPDVFAGPGCGCDAVPAKLAQVLGWSLGPAREGAVLGGYATRQYAGQKVAVAYAADPGSLAGLVAFDAAAGGARVAAKISISGSQAARSAVAAARSAGAKALVVFASPGVVAALKAASAAARWPAPLLAAGSGLAAGLPDGVVTDGFLPTAGAPATGPAGSAAASWTALFAKVKDRYLPKTPFSPALVDGMAAAYQMASALLRAGPSPTRPGLISALDGLPPGPSAAPLAYTQADHGGPQGGYVGVVRAGAVVPTTGVWLASGTPGGSVTAYVGVQAAAPADGAPPR